MSGVTEETAPVLDSSAEQGPRKVTPTRPLYADFQSAFKSIAPHRLRSQSLGMDAMEKIDLDDVPRGVSSSTRPPRIDPGQISTNREPKLRSRAVDVLARAFSNRQARTAAQARDVEHAQEHAQEHEQGYDKYEQEYDEHEQEYGEHEQEFYQQHDEGSVEEYEGDYDEEYEEDYDEAEMAIIGSESPDLDQLRTIQSRRRRSDPFDLEQTYSNVLSDTISSDRSLLQPSSVNENISQLPESHGSNKEKALFTGEKPPRSRNVLLEIDKQLSGNVPGSLPRLPRPKRNLNHFPPKQTQSSDLASASYGDTQNLLAVGQQSSQRRFSAMGGTTPLSAEDVQNMESPLNRLSLYGRQVFGEGGEMDISIGDVRQRPEIKEREVSNALHQQVTNSGPSRSSGAYNREERVWFSQTSSESNDLLSYLGRQESVVGEVAQPSQGFYDQQHIDATWVDTQNGNEVRIPIRQPSSMHLSSHVETVSHEEEDQQDIQANENEWETVADTVSVGNNNPFASRYRQAGSSVANTSDAGQDLEAADLPSGQAVVHHPAVPNHPHRFTTRQIQGGQREVMVPRYTGFGIGTNNSIRTHPFSSPPPERLAVGSQLSRGPIVDFGRDPLTNSSATNGLTISAEAATESTSTSRRLVTSRALMGYDSGLSESMLVEDPHREQSQRLSVPPPLPMRSPLRGSHYLGSQNSLSSINSVNSWGYVYDAANEDEEMVPMVPLAPPRPTYYGQQSAPRGPPGDFYQKIRGTSNQPSKRESHPFKRLTEVKEARARPGSKYHPRTQKPWPRIRSLPGPDGHHLSRSNNPHAANQSTNMGEFQFRDPIWEYQYTAEQLQRIRTNHKRREQQGRTINANIPVPPPQLYPTRRTQFINDRAVLRRQSMLSYISLICCLILPGIGWLLFWYGALDTLIYSLTNGEIEHFGKKQKRIALHLAYLTGLITIGIIVYLIWAVVNHPH